MEISGEFAAGAAVPALAPPGPDGPAGDIFAMAAQAGRAFMAGDRPIVAKAPHVLEDLLGGGLPEAGHGEQVTLQRLIEAGEAGALPSGRPGFFGYVVGGAHPVGVAADWLVSAWDQCAALNDLSPVAVAAEQTCQRWLVDLLGLPPQTVMGLTSGCTTANLACLAAARHAQLRRFGWDVNSQGVAGAPPLRVLVGDSTHVSVWRCLRLLGLADQVSVVRADDQGRMDPVHLAESASGGPGGLIVCGQVGSTDCGSVDPLAELARITHEFGGWLHLDGAYGLWAASSPLLRPLLAGVELADSWSCDAHKWLNTPYDCGLAFCADETALRGALAIDAGYLDTPERAGRDPLDFRVEMSQRARAPMLWAVLYHLGRAGIAALVERGCRAARRLGWRLDGHDGIRLLTPVVLNQVLVHVGDLRHTRRVVEELNASGTCWTTPTTWHDIPAIRMSVSNWQTDVEVIDRVAGQILDTHQLVSAAGALSP
ncbi:pyridoxal phosphate-dependent decarboxylase family protein [Amycolatopsis sp. NPDC059021]|uniref:pyridoxal phosphate-dependent decarboxylase family protein n=1 Tax=Amycolatopsis sp. NPDC059021 TaxID=3346704 RepID=UPI003672DF0E